MNTRILALAVVGLLAPLAHGHFIWLQLDPDMPGKALMRFAEEPEEETAGALQEKGIPMAVRTVAGEPVPFEKGDEAAEGPVPADTNCIAGSLDYGVLDRSEQGRGVFKLVYHAKGTVDVGPAARPVGLPVEIVATVAHDTLTVTVLHDGKPATGAELVAVLPQELEHVEGKTDGEGHGTFPLPQGGWVGIRAMVAVDEAGEMDGTSYTQARHYSTLTFKHVQD